MYRLPHPATGASSTTLRDGRDRVANLKRQLQLERLRIEQEIEQTILQLRGATPTGLHTPTALQDAATLPYGVGGGSQQTSTPNKSPQWFSPPQTDIRTHDSIDYERLAEIIAKKMTCQLRNPVYSPGML